MPLVLLEAGAMGVPVVATPVGNIPFLLNNNNGYIGTIEEIPTLVAGIMTNYEEAYKKGQNLMHDVHAQYNIRPTYLKHVEVYLQ